MSLGDRKKVLTFLSTKARSKNNIYVQQVEIIGRSPSIHTVRFLPVHSGGVELLHVHR
jgi:hypothetical protein